MKDELLRYYQRELHYLRLMGQAYSRRYPKIAGRLEMGMDECADPHVERLIEAFAFLAARIQLNIDNDLPEISTALLNILYPHYLCPVPSMSIAHFEVDPDQGELTAGHPIPRHVRLFAESEPEGVTMRFRTAYPVTLWPLRVEYLDFESVDQFDFLDADADVASVLRLRLRAEGMAMHELELDRLRFFIDGGRMVAYALYELLFCQVRGVALLPDGRGRPVRLPKDCIEPVGFGREEDVLPWQPHSHPGYRLLQEYFCFPEKYLFFELSGLERHGSEEFFDVLFLLDRLPDQRIAPGPETFKLGCTPIVNLFSRYSEPIRLDQRQVEYRLQGDMRREKRTEVHSINHVAAYEPGETDTEVYAPYFSFDHHMEAAGQKAFWISKRMPATGQGLQGTDVLLSFVDLDFKPTLPAARSVYAHVLCTNRHMAEEVPAGAALQIEEAAPLHAITMLKKPTLQRDPPLGGESLWRLISHLSLNHLSLSNEEGSLKALREMLNLYSAEDDPHTLQQIAGIRNMSTRRVVRRVLGDTAWQGFARGLEVRLEFDESLYVGSSAYLMAAVLNRFLAMYTAINSFTQLRITSLQREGTWKQWPPMAGDQIIL
jgi:type VI secretion system protein ImpG